MWDDTTLDAVRKIAITAGKEILDVYHQDEAIEVTLKGDNSPLTEADRRANEIIVEELENLHPRFPVLSEESEAVDFDMRRSWNWYWLVDPLDGTKEFVKRNGEFTVNIALIHDGNPMLGVVHVPVSGVTYLGSEDRGAWKEDESGNIQKIETRSIADMEPPVKVVASRSHRGDEVDGAIAKIEAALGKTEVVSMGSSLKICLVAEGVADIYPRLAPTCEWDTAAAHAVVKAAGGEIVDTNFVPLRYNQKEELLNPHFIVLGDTTYHWQEVINS